MTREQYKEQFLKKNRVKNPTRMSLILSRETRNRLKQLCSASDNGRVATGNLVEKIVEEHCSTHEGTIQELYKHDIPVY